MDGLECNEMFLSAIRDDNGWFRLDSHFYEKQYVKLKKKLSDMPHWFLKDIVAKPIQTGHTPSMKTEEYYNGHIAFIKTDNLHVNQISASFSDYLTDKGNSTIARTSLQESDIITTIIGATEEVIARSALVSREYLPANINQNIARIRIKKDVALPEYVSAYLNSKYGRNYLHYLSRQTEQVNLNCQEMGLVIVPKFSTVLQNRIKICIAQANKLQEKAKASFAKAEEILSLQFSIESFAFSLDNTSVRSIRDSFLTSGRLDAEYYQDKYQTYEKAIFLAPKGYVFVKDKFEQVKTKCARNLSSYNYVEIGDIDVGTGSVSFRSIETKELPDNAKIMTIKGDLLVSTVRPNRGAVAILESDNLLVSGAFTVLREKDGYPKEVLQALFRTSMYKDWLLRFNVGTSYPVIKDNDVLNMPIPVLEKNIEEIIVSNIRKAYCLRNQSKQLIEYANQAVEMAIEKSEEQALNWLSEKGVES